MGFQRLTVNSALKRDDFGKQNYKNVNNPVKIRATLELPNWPRIYSNSFYFYHSFK